jgi:phage tail sheath protein FI
MAFQVSPGVQVKEIDLTNVVPAVSTSIGGFVGAFSWGPAEEIRTVSSEKELVNTFGSPNDTTAKSFFTAASFLKYATALKVVRVVPDGSGGSTTAKNSTSGSGGNIGLLIKNRQSYEDSYEGGAANVGVWGAKFPGVLGDSLRVEVCSSSAAFGAWTTTVNGAVINYASNFDAAPGTSAFAAQYGASNDEIHIVVIDEDGLISGTKGQVLEKFAFVSQASDAVKADGTSNYYKNVVNTESNYIYWLDHFDAPDGQALIMPNSGEAASAGISFGTESTVKGYSLSGGANGSTVGTSQLSTGIDVFADAETVDVNLLFSTNDANGANTIAEKLISVANARKDIVVFVSPPTEDTVGTATPAADVKTWADTLTSTSYAVIDSTAVKVYDKYNDVYRWIPACGHVAGLCAYTDNVADAWFSPAGLNRGQLLGITKIAFNPKQADRDTLYKARINPIVSFPGQGTVLYGDKTALAKPSAFDRINVRRLFIALEKSVATAAKFQLFELNDEFTRAMFRNMVEPFLRDVQGRRGITDFKVVCDETNNTGDVIDRNEFRADIYIKPARSINFITLNFIATRTGVDFSELVGK